MATMSSTVSGLLDQVHRDRPGRKGELAARLVAVAGVAVAVRDAWHDPGDGARSLARPIARLAAAATQSGAPL